MVVIAALLLTACGGDDDSAEPTASTTSTTEAPKEIVTINMGTPTAGWAAAPYFFGDEKGLYADEGLDLDITVGQSPVLTAAAVAGEIPYLLGIGTLIQAGVVSGNSPFKVILVTTGVPLFDVIARPNVKSFEDLRGKGFGVNAVGDGSHLVGVQHLEAHGLEADDVAAIGLGAPPNILEALRAGTVEAAQLTPPVNLLALKAGMVRLARGTDLPPQAIGGLAATTSYLAEHQDEAKMLLRGTLRSIEYMRDNRPEVEKWMQTFYNLPEDDAAMIAEAYDLTMQSLVPTGQISDRYVEDQIELAARINKVDNPTLRPADIIDYSLLEKAKKDE